VDDREPTPDADKRRRARLDQRLRRAFIVGAEEDSRRRLGRGLTVEELERVLRRYLGDLPESPKPVGDARRATGSLHDERFLAALGGVP
jgi:hypothetical protein